MGANGKIDSSNHNHAIRHLAENPAVKRSAVADGGHVRDAKSGASRIAENNQRAAELKLQIAERQKAAPKPAMTAAANRAANVNRPMMPYNARDQFADAAERLAKVQKEFGVAHQKLAADLVKYSPTLDGKQRAAYATHFTETNDYQLHKLELKGASEQFVRLLENKSAWKTLKNAAARDPEMAKNLYDSLKASAEMLKLSDSKTIKQDSRAIVTRTLEMFDPKISHQAAFDPRASNAAEDILAPAIAAGAGAMLAESAADGKQDAGEFIAEFKKNFLDTPELLHVKGNDLLMKMEKYASEMQAATSGAPTDKFDDVMKIGSDWEEKGGIGRTFAVLNLFYKGAELSRMTLGDGKTFDGKDQATLLKKLQTSAEGAQALLEVGSSVLSTSAKARALVTSATNASGAQIAKGISFAGKAAPFVGFVAGALAFSNSREDYLNNPNDWGKGMTMVGDAMSMVGSGVSAVPVFAPIGTVVSVAGGFISGAGGYASGEIEKYNDNQQAVSRQTEILAKVFRGSSESPIVEGLVGADPEQVKTVAARLRLSPKDFQRVAVAAPELLASDSPRALRAIERFLATGRR